MFIRCNATFSPLWPLLLFPWLESSIAHLVDTVAKGSQLNFKSFIAKRHRCKASQMKLRRDREKTKNKIAILIRHFICRIRAFALLAFRHITLSCGIHNNAHIHPKESNVLDFHMVCSSSQYKTSYNL